MLAGGALGLGWSQVYSVPRSLPPEASDHSRRSLWLCKWMTAVFAPTAAGSLAYAVADWISYWDDPERWMRIASGSFYVSYCVIALLGLYATRQLYWRALLLASGEDPMPSRSVGQALKSSARSCER